MYNYMYVLAAKEGLQIQELPSPAFAESQRFVSTVESVINTSNHASRLINLTAATQVPMHN